MTKMCFSGWKPSATEIAHTLRGCDSPHSWRLPRSAWLILLFAFWPNWSEGERISRLHFDHFSHLFCSSKSQNSLISCRTSTLSLENESHGGSSKSIGASVPRQRMLVPYKKMSRLRFKNATASGGDLSNWAGESAGAECRRYRRPLLGLDSFAWWRVQLPKFSWYRTFRKTAKSMTSLCLTLDLGGWGNFENFIFKVETFLNLASGNYMELIISINSHNTDKILWKIGDRFSENVVTMFYDELSWIV